MATDLSSVAEAPYDARSLGGASSAPTLGKESFLKLLVVQLSNQDPLSPAEPTEFISQLAQFTSLEQLNNLNEGLNVLAISQTAATSAQMVSFVGQIATFASDSIVLTKPGESTEVHYSLDDNADEVTVQLLDESGSVVRTLELGAQASGSQTVPFDGRNEFGGPLPPGTYTLQVTAKDEDGGHIGVRTKDTGMVTGVTFENGYPQLVMADGRKVTLNNILTVSSPDGLHELYSNEQEEDASSPAVEAAPVPGTSDEGASPETDPEAETDGDEALSDPTPASD